MENKLFLLNLSPNELLIQIRTALFKHFFIVKHIRIKTRGPEGPEALT